MQSLGYERHSRKQSVGVIQPGSYHFGTEAAERMTIVNGEAQVVVDGSDASTTYAAGTAFEIAGVLATISCQQPCVYWCELISKYIKGLPCVP